VNLHSFIFYVMPTGMPQHSFSEHTLFVTHK
jgi:hypothetical protein